MKVLVLAPLRVKVLLIDNFSPDIRRHVVQCQVFGHGTRPGHHKAAGHHRTSRLHRARF